jgi:N-acetyl-anhydromuramyl-L-alanine amidase AmpD
MDCGKRDGLKAMYAEAVKGWTEVDPSRQNDPKVVAAWDKVAKAEQAVIDHREAHGC